MQFVRVNGLLDGLEPLSSRITSELGTGKRVLWLVPGGSNIPLSVAVMNRIPTELTNRLTIMLTDERYGDVGHRDSNTVQLDVAGFRPHAATVLPVLHDTLSLDETVANYAADFETNCQQADSIIGQFGMGADGHMAGMLPESGAVKTDKLTYGYHTATFTRITLTPHAISRVAAAYVFAFGAEKSEALTRLRDESLNLHLQPAQILKQLPEAYVYNDQVSEIHH
ncbi:MAG TPA: 6-phosphogluconolactonase [Hymenobacter sp.]